MWSSPSRTSTPRSSSLRDVDDHRRPRDAELHHRDERLPAGDGLGVGLGEQLECVVEIGRARVAGRRGNHEDPPPRESTRRSPGSRCSGRGCRGAHAGSRRRSAIRLARGCRLRSGAPPACRSRTGARGARRTLAEADAARRPRRGPDRRSPAGGLVRDPPAGRGGRAARRGGRPRRSREGPVGRGDPEALPTRPERADRGRQRHPYGTLGALHADSQEAPARRPRATRNTVG